MKNLIYFIGIFAVMALGSCSSQDTEEIKLRKIEIELLSSKIVALDSLYKELELCDTEDFESMWKILKRLDNTPAYEESKHLR